MTINIFLIKGDLNVKIVVVRFFFARYITDSSFARKINNWKVDEEIFLKSDHKLITFELETVKNTETVERWNFKAVNWKNGRLSVI